MSNIKKKIPSLLAALEYEKVSFDNVPEISLFSETLPLNLYMGRLAETPHRSLILKISTGGQNILLHSNDKTNLHQLVENAYVSSWLNGTTRAFYYYPIGYASFHSEDPVCLCSDTPMMISQIDTLYSLCKENEKLSDSKKMLYIVMISNLSDIPFFSDALLEGTQIKRSQSFMEQENINPFEKLDVDSTNDCVFQNDDNNTSISVNQKLEDMLTNGCKYGITFIIGESDPEKCMKLTKYAFNLLELDCMEVNNIVTGLRETDRVLAWSSNKPEDIDSFLERESPLYRTVKAYCNYSF